MTTFTALLHVRYALSLSLCLVISTVSSQDLAVTDLRITAAGSMQESTMPLIKVLHDAEKKYQVTFMFKDDALRNKRVPLDVPDATSLDVLLQRIRTATELNVEKTGSKLYTVFEAKATDKQAP